MRMEFRQDRLDKLRRQKPEKQLTVWDTKTTGLCVLVSPGPAGRREATVRFRVAYYLKEFPGRPIYTKLGLYSGKAEEIKRARSEAAKIRREAEEGKNPKRPKLADEPFEEVVRKFIDDHAKRNNRTWAETERIFERYVTPEWRGRRVEDIKRSDIRELQRKIAAGKIRQRVERPDGKSATRLIGSTPSADAALAQIRKLLNWYALDHEDYRSPIVRGMRLAKPGERKRQLSDAELRALWSASGQMGIFGAAVRTMLLTAQRVKKVEQMRRGDVKDRFLIPGHEGSDGAWVEDQLVENIWDPTRDDDPENKQVSVVPLSPAARAIIDAVPAVDAERGRDYVFSLNGREPINGRSKNKDKLDRLMRAALRAQAEAAGEDPEAVELKPWELRDLRRTARTLLSRAGVSTDISERCLAHVMQGVRGTYDRYDYIPDKRIAFDKLAALVERIVNPPAGGNVIALPAGRREA